MRVRANSFALLCSALAALSLSLAKPTSADGTESLVDLTARVIPSVVAVHTMLAMHPSMADAHQAKLQASIAQAEGSGFFVSPDGLIATNKHVIQDAYQVSVTLHDGSTVDANVIWKSSVVDVAILKINAIKPLIAATLAHDQTLRLGQRVIAVGNPMGLGISVSAGIVSALNRNLKQSPFDDFIQTDAAINHGSSGGPLFDERGEVVGMNSVLYSSVDEGGSQGLGFAIPGTDLSFVIEQLKSKGRIACGWLGLQGQTTTPAMRQALGFGENYGVIVASVNAHSAAEKAGLKQGDILVSMDGHTLGDTAELRPLRPQARYRGVELNPLDAAS